MRKQVRPKGRWVLLFLISIGFTPTFAQQVAFAPPTPPHQPTTIQLQAKPLKAVLNQIQKEQKVRFNYNSDLIKDKTISLDLSKVYLNNMEQLLNVVLKPYGLTVEKIGNKRYVIFPLQAPANKTSQIQPQELTPINVSGKVTDQQGSPLPGVTILIKGTNTGTVTNTEGDFTLQADEKDILLLSYIGFATKEVSVNGQSKINVQMEEDTKALEEVVVTGYMTQKKADLTGSVAVITPAVIEKNNYSNVIQGLQGRVPGMFITTDGNPVGNATVQIRGLTSMRSAPPLIVVDGLPTNMNLRDINPNDIASMQVLKDAASASIYGSRAASGVILIQTKNGKAGETKVTYDGYVGVSSFMNRIKMMNTQQYGQALWQAAINDGRDPNEVTQIYDFEWHRGDDGIALLDKVSPIEWLNAEKTMPSADTDWFDAGSQLGLQNNHNLTISNGTDKARTMLSLNYHENRGTQIHTGFRRYALRLNSDYTLLKDRLMIGENLSVSHLKLNDQNHSHSFLTMPPIIPVYTTDGGWGGTAYNLGMDDYNNPVRMLTQGKDNGTNYTRILGSIYADLRLFKGLQLKSLFGADYTSGYFRHIDFTWKEGGGKQDIINGVRNRQTHALTSTWTNTLNYNVNVGKHNLDFLAGIEAVKFTAQEMEGYRRDIEFEDYDYAYLNSATGNQEVYGTGDEWGLLSYFSKFNYVFNQKYLLSATMRYDGSSKFGVNNRFGFFPAVSAGWRLSEENFLKDNVGFISDLKLRASWGKNGNSNIPTNALVNYYVADYRGTGYGLAGNETGTIYSGYRRAHIGNPDLKWEATAQTDIGLDFGLFNGSVSGSFDYFYKVTDGMLYEPPYIGAIGEGDTAG
ncbi:SusC/RagA family TonB-linked outer membrane protein [Rhodocytophaga rosea]|uniref:SusC/RagA family TonB-linked outer membrane protein n=1 Tax=Rhodocytophaga rosea TaxID=2704465 RepID=A0A6C0GB64_9BACT|nr:SusC/RagA family TonB-linked outer membrane protein [Rhodocytophaga rosea]QHT65199.1 SusC/RagA family TonB-linked outer membrane protein [Rhodocytophaga rosea]